MNRPDFAATRRRLDRRAMTRRMMDYLVALYSELCSAGFTAGVIGNVIPELLKSVRSFPPDPATRIIFGKDRELQNHDLIRALLRAQLAAAVDVIDLVIFQVHAAAPTPTRHVIIHLLYMQLTKLFADSRDGEIRALWKLRKRLSTDLSKISETANHCLMNEFTLSFSDQEIVDIPSPHAATGQNLPNWQNRAAMKLLSSLQEQYTLGEIPASLRDAILGGTWANLFKAAFAEELKANSDARTAYFVDTMNVISRAIARSEEETEQIRLNIQEKLDNGNGNAQTLRNSLGSIRQKMDDLINEQSVDRTRLHALFLEQRSAIEQHTAVIRDHISRMSDSIIDVVVQQNELTRETIATRGALTAIDLAAVECERKRLETVLKAGACLEADVMRGLCSFDSCIVNAAIRKAVDFGMNSAVPYILPNLRSTNSSLVEISVWALGNLGNSQEAGNAIIHLADTTASAGLIHKCVAALQCLNPKLTVTEDNLHIWLRWLTGPQNDLAVLSACTLRKLQREGMLDVVSFKDDLLRACQREVCRGARVPALWMIGQVDNAPSMVRAADVVRDPSEELRAKEACISMLARANDTQPVAERLLVLQQVRLQSKAAISDEEIVMYAFCRDWARVCAICAGAVGQHSTLNGPSVPRLARGRSVSVDSTYTIATGAISLGRQIQRRATLATSTEFRTAVERFKKPSGRLSDCPNAEVYTIAEASTFRVEDMVWALTSHHSFFAVDLRGASESIVAQSIAHFRAQTYCAVVLDSSIHEPLVRLLSWWHGRDRDYEMYWSGHDGLQVFPSTCKVIFVAMERDWHEAIAALKAHSGTMRDFADSAAVTPWNFLPPA